MDAAVPVDAKNARPPGTWKTVENAVSHSAHTHYCFRERMIENGESTSVAKPSTESDQAHRSSLVAKGRAIAKMEIPVYTYQAMVSGGESIVRGDLKQ